MVKGKTKSVSFGGLSHHQPEVSIISESSSVDITDGAKMSTKKKPIIKSTAKSGVGNKAKKVCGLSKKTERHLFLHHSNPVYYYFRASISFCASSHWLLSSNQQPIIDVQSERCC